MSPSVSEKRRSGKRTQKSAHSNSTRVRIDITDDVVILTLAGASLGGRRSRGRAHVAAQDRADVARRREQRVPLPEWIDGICSASGSRRT